VFFAHAIHHICYMNTTTTSHKPKATLLVRRRTSPMQVVIAAYDARTARVGKTLAAEPLPKDFTQADLVAAARRLVPLVSSHEVVLPTGVEL
jgi:hypothetical protein